MHYVYLIRSLKSPSRIYVGNTVNLIQRLETTIQVVLFIPSHIDLGSWSCFWVLQINLKRQLLKGI